MEEDCKLKPITEWIQEFLNQMSVKDFEIIGEILCWNDNKKIGFMLAKNIALGEKNDRRNKRNSASKKYKGRSHYN